jgi:DNA-binding NarL/FixJ family response regulator
MDAASTDGMPEPEPDGGDGVDVRRWMRDMAALLALPALWVDHEPNEIATGLLSVLFGVLQLDGAYARFDDPRDGGPPLETWRPSGPEPPAEVRHVLATATATDPPPGVTTTDVEVADGGRRRVASLPVSLPWERGMVIVSATRADFPTERETHLLRTAVGQAAIAIHTARRIAREHAARAAAETTLARQRELLRSFIDEVGPTLESLASVTRHAEEAIRLSDAGGRAGVAHREADEGAPAAVGSADGPPPRSALARTRRGTEVLGLLAQGLNNREIAGVMWLSDRTVERHITSLYRKIGVARRSEATAFALRHGLG